MTRPRLCAEDGTRTFHIAGTPGAWIKQGRRWQACGIGALFLLARGPDPRVQMRRFMDEVAIRA